MANITMEELYSSWIEFEKELSQDAFQDAIAELNEQFYSEKQEEFLLNILP